MIIIITSPWITSIPIHAQFPDREHPLDKHSKKIIELEPEEAASGAPFAPLVFGAAAKEYMQKCVMLLLIVS